MLTRTESLPWHSPRTAVASYLGSGFRSVWGDMEFGPQGLGAMGCFLCESKIFEPGNWMVGTLIVSFWGVV